MEAIAETLPPTGAAPSSSVIVDAAADVLTTAAGATATATASVAAAAAAANPLPEILEKVDDVPDLGSALSDAGSSLKTAFLLLMHAAWQTIKDGFLSAGAARKSGWNRACILWAEHRHNLHIDWRNLRDRLVHFSVWILHQANRLIELLVCQNCVVWLHEKTGIDKETLVLAAGASTLILLLGLVYRIHPRTRKARKRRKERKHGHRRTNHPEESVRSVRDRGFSMDFSVPLPREPSAPAANRHLRLDFLDYLWNAKRTRPPSTGNGYDGGAAASRVAGGANRERSFSMGMLGGSTDLDDRFNQALQHGFGAGTPNSPEHDNHTVTRHQQRQIAAAAVAYYGPTETRLIYSTVTPPPSWTEASRSLLPTDTRLSLQREIALDLSKDECLMKIREPPSSSNRQGPMMATNPVLTLPVSQCSIHVKTPILGGVLQIYVKESTKDEWMEHTFDTAKNAAQFQLDLLAVQLFGPALHRMYQCLELIHQGSMACDGREYVCHHDSRPNVDNSEEDVPQGIGVPWDDVMRALGGNLPSLRAALERIWWHHYSINSLRLQARKRARKEQKNGATKEDGGAGDDENGGDSGSAPAAGSKDDDPSEVNPKKKQNEYIHLNKEYVKKRLLIGPVDFFRLFVPCLPETALPLAESSRKRMEQLMRWRKRTASAALLVQAYVKARIVVNHGWNLHRPLPTHYRTRRLAFDDNLDNTQRDSNAKNEVYEGTVSRDVMCFVRPNVPDAFKTEEYWWNWRPQRVRTVVSKYQAFTLVGNHVFKIPPDEEFPLNPRRDPLLAFGSLREMVEAHPDVEFLISAWFTEITHTAFVTVFARTLPPGMDAAFDKSMSRYKHGSKMIRDKKLSVMIQLSTLEEKKTYTEATATTVVTHLMKSLADGVDASTPTSDMGPSDRKPFPVIPATTLGETRHFGGALQEDCTMPKNYVAFTLHIDATRARFNILARVLLTMLERGLLYRNVFDVTFVLAAQEQDELPERALSTFRMVRVAAQEIALPSIYVYGSHRLTATRRSTQDANFFKSTMQMFSMKNVMGTDSIVESNDDDDGNAIQVQRNGPFCLEARRGDNASVLNSFRTSIIPSEDPIEQSVNTLIDILEAVRIPVRRDQLSQYDFASSVPVDVLDGFHSRNDGNFHEKDLINMSLLLLITRGEIRRHFVASGCSLKKASIRIVETAAWRGQTFPIDRRICRIELQSGQFFQQGLDKEGRPVFYVRNVGLGPWRKDTDAAIASVLHRLEGALHEFSGRQEDVQCTVVIMMGKPFKEYVKLKMGDAGSTDGGDADKDDGGASEISVSVRDGKILHDGLCIANPRVNSEETWQAHTDKKLVRQIIDLLSAHYPERLHQALVVVKPKHKLMVSKIFGRFTIGNLIDSPVTRSKIKLLLRFSDLQKYISKHELSIIAGGDQPIEPEIFGLFDPIS